MNRRGSYWMNLLKGIDYGAATLAGIPAGIYISGYVAYKRYDSRGKQPWVFFERAINILFRDDFHCLKAMRVNLEDIKQYYEGDQK
jgi:hypothetical protein